ALTSERAPAAGTEKRRRVTTAIAILNVAPGYCARSVKKPDSGLLTAVLANSSSPARKNSNAPFPKIEIHSKMKLNGINSTPSTNLRSVRPREIRAKKSPTKAAHAIHQAQKNSVQSCIHAAAEASGLPSV